VRSTRTMTGFLKGLTRSVSERSEGASGDYEGLPSKRVTSVQSGALRTLVKGSSGAFRCGATRFVVPKAGADRSGKSCSRRRPGFAQLNDEAGLVRTALEQERGRAGCFGRGRKGASDGALGARRKDGQ